MPAADFKVGEMLHKRTRNSKTWMNFDGSYTTEIHPGAVHFVDEYGNLQNINTDLFDEADFDVIDEPVSVEGVERFKQSRKETRAAKKNDVLDRSQHNFQALRVPFDVHIPRNFQRGYTIGKGVDKLTFKPVKASPSTGELSQTDRSAIVYQDVWNDTDVELKIQPDGIKETLYLKTDKAPSSFSFEVKGKEIAADFTAGTLKLMPAWLVDAAGTYRDVEQNVVTRSDNKVYVELIAPVEGLVYPIEIDPTVTVLDSTSNIRDATIDSATPTTNSQSMRFSSTTRNLYEFDLDGLPVNRVTDAVFSFSTPGSQAGSVIDTTLHRVRDAWSESGVTWNTRPSYSSTVIASRRLSDFQVNTYNLTSLVNDWLDGTYTNNGVIILSTGTGYYNASSSEDGSANGPKLSITFNTPPNAPSIIAPNGGENWNAQHTISWTPSTDEDSSSLRYQIDLSSDNGSTWKTIVPLTAVNVSSHEYDFSNELESALSTISIRAYDGTSYSSWDESSGVFTIQHNQAPLAPSNLLPSGTIINRSLVTRLSWKHNDPNAEDYQSKADIQWRVQGAAVWNDIFHTGINQYADINSGTFPAGAIEWRVRTYDQDGLSSPYANPVVFNAADQTNAPTLVKPADTVNGAQPVVEWVATSQTAYQIQIEDSANAIVWDSGEVAGTVRARTVGVSLINGQTYKARVRVKDNGGIFSAYAEKSFAVSFVPPSVPDIDVSEKPAPSTVEIKLTNAAPVGMEPLVVRHEIFRRAKGEVNWMRLAVDVQNSGTFSDYTAAGGKVYEYYAKAWGDNGTYRDSLTVEGVTIIEHAELALISDYSARVQLEYNTSISQSKSYGRTLQRFAGRSYPMAEFSPEDTLALSTDYILKDRDSLDALYTLLDKKETLLYRDREGRRAFVTIGGVSEDEIGFGEWFGVSFQMDQVYVKEEV